jgi:hypothetical protein
MHAAERAVARIIFTRIPPERKRTASPNGISLYQTKDFDKDGQAGKETPVRRIHAVRRARRSILGMAKWVCGAWLEAEQSRECR